jgi:hypothetical protein
LSTPPATSVAVPDAERDAPSASRLERAFRAAMLLVTFAVCCYVAYGFGCWWALARQAPPAAPLSSAAELDPLAAVLGGQWAFDEIDWNLKSQLIERGALDAELAQLGTSPLSKFDS